MQTHRVRLPFLRLDHPRSNDTFVVHEGTANARYLAQLTNLDVAAQLVHFVFDVREEILRLELRQQRDHAGGPCLPRCMRNGV